MNEPIDHAKIDIASLDCRKYSRSRVRRRRCRLRLSQLIVLLIVKNNVGKGAADIDPDHAHLR